MKNLEWKQGKINPKNFWDLEEIKKLEYVKEPFNDEKQLQEWLNKNYLPRTGYQYNSARTYQPKTSELLKIWATNLKNIGITYYRMDSGDNLPYHKDLYKKYIEKFSLKNKENKIWRYVFFVEDWKPGHIFEIGYNPIIKWKSGDYVAWNYDIPHLAANLGDESRYTIQLTGEEI